MAAETRRDGRNPSRRCAATVAIMSIAAALTGCAASAANTTDSSSIRAASVDDLRTTEVYREGRLLFAGQPSREQLLSLAGGGVGTVINLRTQAEMDRLPFDEAALFEAIGVEYIHIPLGREGYEPATVEAFAEALERSPGDVLIHCGSGGRARTVYAAYLIRRQGLTPGDATKRIRELGQPPSSLERLLGEDLELRRQRPTDGLRP